MGKLVNGPSWAIIINVVLWAVLIVLYATRCGRDVENDVQKAAVPSRMDAHVPCEKQPYRVPLLEVRSNHKAGMAGQAGYGEEESVDSGRAPQAVAM